MLIFKVAFKRNVESFAITCNDVTKVNVEYDNKKDKCTAALKISGGQKDIELAMYCENTIVTLHFVSGAISKTGIKQINKVEIK